MRLAINQKNGNRFAGWACIRPLGQVVHAQARSGSAIRVSLSRIFAAQLDIILPGGRQIHRAMSRSRSSRRMGRVFEAHRGVSTRNGGLEDSGPKRASRGESCSKSKSNIACRPRPVGEQLRRWSAHLAEDREDADAYFNAPHRDFAKTDEAFRVRRIGPKNFITYKGPKTDAQTKTRREIEVALANGVAVADQFQELVTALGFRPVAVVRKRRRVYDLTGGGFTLHICLDDVTGVGQYAEVEIVAPESELDRAKAVVLQVAADLGLTEMERRSYLELLLNQSSGKD